MKQASIQVMYIHKYKQAFFAEQTLNDFIGKSNIILLLCYSFKVLNGLTLFLCLWYDIAMK